MMLSKTISFVLVLVFLKKRIFLLEISLSLCLLVMRTTGVLRVILNAHIVAGMKFDFANDNCLRFTYVDGIYLIKVC